MTTSDQTSSPVTSASESEWIQALQRCATTVGVEVSTIVDLLVKALLGEFDKLKNEQWGRIRERGRYPVLVLGSIVGVITLATTLRHAGVLLVYPIVSMLLGWNYLAHDDKISDMGAYVRTTLIPPLAAVLPAGTPVFGWESFDDPRRTLRKIVQLGADLSTFCLPPAAAVLAFWGIGPCHPMLVVVSAVELLLVAGLAALIVLYTDISTKRPASVATASPEVTP